MKSSEKTFNIKREAFKFPNTEKVDLCFSLWSRSDCSSTATLEYYPRKPTAFNAPNVVNMFSRSIKPNKNPSDQSQRSVVCLFMNYVSLSFCQFLSRVFDSLSVNAGVILRSCFSKCAFGKYSWVGARYWPLKSDVSQHKQAFDMSDVIALISAAFCVSHSDFL